MMMDEINFEDNFNDIVSKDNRYDARAYALLCDVLLYLFEQRKESGGGNVGGEQILDEFRDRALDQYGPLTYTVLTEWGLKSTEDIGEMMFNLADAKRIIRNEEDTREAFVDGYDFKEAFLEPYQA